MRNLFLLIIAGLIVAGFIIYMSTYTVHFTDTAIVSTFGKIDEDSVVTDEGLKWKFPAPIQSVTLYDKRARVLTAQPETQQTADNRPIAISSFLTWRVADPLRFYRAYREDSADARLQYEDAEQDLLSRLRSALSETSQYRLDELFASGAGESKLDELEEDILRNIRGGDEEAGRFSKLGIEVMLVGINQVEFPEQTTTAVFERMKETRQAIAEKARSEGEAEAARIKSEADAAVDTIMAWVELRASEIERRGQQEAEKWYAVLAEHEALAVFLEELNFMREGFQDQTTFILPTDLLALRLLDAPSFADMVPPADSEVPAESAADAEAEASVSKAAPRASETTQGDIR